VVYKLSLASPTGPHAGEGQLVRRVESASGEPVSGEPEFRLTCWGLKTLEARVFWSWWSTESGQKVYHEGEPVLPADVQPAHIRVLLKALVEPPAGPTEKTASLPVTVNVVPVDLIRELGKHWIDDGVAAP
jgi:hypothetical protein